MIFYRLIQSLNWYKKLTALKESEEYNHFDSAKKRVLKSMLQDQELSGVHLDQKKKQEILEISQEKSKCSLSFQQNINQSIQEYSYVIHDPKKVEGMPEKILARFSATYKEKTGKDSSPSLGPWLVGIDQNSYFDIQKYCPSRNVRKKVFQDYHCLASEGKRSNLEIAKNILKLRSKTAEILGFKDYTQMTLKEKMAENVENVNQLHETMRNACRASYNKEMAMIKDMFKDIYGEEEDFQEWDEIYCSKKIILRDFFYDELKVREYFVFDNVLNELFVLIKNLFSVDFEEITSKVDKKCLWDEDVRIYAVKNTGSSGILAYMYLDPYARPGSKQGNAWTNGVRMRNSSSDPNNLNGNDYKRHLYNVPQAYVICNFLSPTKEHPCLLDFTELQVLFHEFGHMLQQVLSTVDIPVVSGTSGIEWDAIEFPSQFMEYWIYTKNVFMKMAKHYETGDALPQELYEKIIAAKNFGAARVYMRKISLGMVDIALHLQENAHKDMFRCYEEILATTEKTPTNPYRVQSLMSFSPIFYYPNYPVGFYSYIWSEVMSADAFAKFEEANLENHEEMAAIGKHFRDTVLALGGSVHPQEVFLQFRGSPPKIDALLSYNGLKQK